MPCVTGSPGHDQFTMVQVAAPCAGLGLLPIDSSQVNVQGLPGGDQLADVERA